jgi:hypothetical protein
MEDNAVSQAQPPDADKATRKANLIGTDAEFDR